MMFHTHPLILVRAVRDGCLKLLSVTQSSTGPSSLFVAGMQGHKECRVGLDKGHIDNPAS